MRTSSHSSSRGWSGERELEWKPESELEISPSRTPGPPQGPRERIRGLLQTLTRRLRRLPEHVPGPATVAMGLLFLGLAWLTTFLGGCFLVRWLERPAHALWIMGMLTVGIPILLAPRPTREPLGWGIVLNWVALMAFGFAAPYTTAAVDHRGSWLEDALATTGGTVAWGVPGRAAWVVSAWGLQQIPESFLQEWYGPPIHPLSAPSAAQYGNAARKQTQLERSSPLHPPLQEREEGGASRSVPSSPLTAGPRGTRGDEHQLVTPSPLPGGTIPREGSGQGTSDSIGAER